MSGSYHPAVAHLIGKTRPDAFTMSALAFIDGDPVEIDPRSPTARLLAASCVERPMRSGEIIQRAEARSASIHDADLRDQKLFDSEAEAEAEFDRLTRGLFLCPMKLFGPPEMTSFGNRMFETGLLGLAALVKGGFEVSPAHAARIVERQQHALTEGLRERRAIRDWLNDPRASRGLLEPQDVEHLRARLDATASQAADLAERLRKTADSFAQR